MLVQDLINAAMRSAGIIASGESPSTTESADALFALNQMVDSWSAERLLIPSTPRTVLTLPSNASGSFQIGPGAADFPLLSRPLKIERAGFILPGETSTVEIPMRILNDDEWAAEEVKSVPSTLPTALYCDYGYPFVTIYTWPILTVGGSLALYMWQPVAAFVNLTDTVALPSGYPEAIQYNLAGRLAMEYGQAPNPVLVQLAMDLKDRLKAANPATYLLRCEGANHRSFNIYTGEGA